MNTAGGIMKATVFMDPGFRRGDEGKREA